VLTAKWRRFVVAIFVSTVVVSVASMAGVADADPGYGDIIGPVTATSIGVRVPTTGTEFNRLSVAQRARIAHAAQARFGEVLALINSGQKEVHSVTAQAFSPRVGPRKGASVSADHVQWYGQCEVRWTDYPGSGTMVWGYGYTAANPVQPEYVAVSGEFLKDGAVVVASFGAANSDGYADASTTGSWRAWYEPSYVYRTNTWHTVRDLGAPYAYSAYQSPCSIWVTK
jgi:hypothetical protein